MYSKKISLSSIVLILLTGCGGGGSIKTEQPPPVSTIPPIVTVPNVPEPTKFPVALGSSDAANTQILSRDRNGANAAYQSGLFGKGVTVGIIDSDFDLKNSEYEGRLVKTVLYQDKAPEGNGNNHGTIVAEVIGGKNMGVAPKVSIEAIAAGNLGSGSTVWFNSDTYKLLSDKGIKIVNNSNGYGYIGMPDIERWSKGVKDTVGQYIEGGGLVIWAAGNDYDKNPLLTAAAPYYHPELEKGYLTVVGVGSAINLALNRPIGILSVYSNACGVAANWCLAAPIDFFTNAGGYHVGTSYSAPTVTGAAALVSEKYPWMNGDMLRQTILSTATSMNDRETYGWGLLNVSKAVNGPSLFDKSLALNEYVNINFDSFVSDFSNNISGNAGMIKDGNGTLILSGKNTYTGDNIIKNGTLSLTGSISSNVNVEKNGTVSGEGGVINAHVNNSGRLNSVGKGLNINGDYNAASGSKTGIEFNSPLNVSGVTKIDNSKLIAMTPNNVESLTYVNSQEGKTTPLIISKNGINGKFNDLSFESNGIIFSPGLLLSGEVSYSPDSVLLKIVRKSPVNAVEENGIKNLSQVMTAQNLELGLREADTMSVLENNVKNKYLNSAAEILNTPDKESLKLVLDSLSGSIYASSQSLNVQQSQMINNDLSNRIASLQNNPTGFWANGITTKGKIDDENFANAKTSMDGVHIGIDKKINSNSIIGISLVNSSIKANFDRLAGYSKGENNTVSLYALHKLNSGYISGRIGYGNTKTEVERSLLLGNNLKIIKSNYDSEILSSYLEYGYVNNISNTFKLTPFFGVSYDNYKRGEFKEVGDDFGLLSKKTNYENASGIIGLRLDKAINWNNKKSNLKVYGNIIQNFKNTPFDFTTSYVGSPNASFNVQGIQDKKITGWIGAGITTNISDKWMWYSNVDVQLNDKKIKNKIFSVGLKMFL